MVIKSLSTDALSGLCTQEQLDLLDSIDTLRLQGISHYISLPQIIVCGDQSSGKSSVLEAISGVAFPVKSNLCTRFPTELVLRKSLQTGVSVSIVPHQSRSDAEKQSLGSFREHLESFDGLPPLIEKAKAVMGISTHGKAFSNDLLRVEVSGPDRPHLTIVDLPGLIHSETKQQSADDVKLVQNVVQGYMKEPRSIILAVVSAKNDYANQIVLNLARNADESGMRTLGVITKPDTLIPGSESESLFVALAKNQDVTFNLGWHVLKNMDTDKGKGTLLERNAQEQDFFSQGVWEFMPRTLLGIDSLRTRLSKLLLAQIASELPSLINEIEKKLDDCQEELKLLGDARESQAQQQSYLFQISQSFQSVVKAAIDGTYNDDFFDSTKTRSGIQKRIRAVIQNLNEDFAQRMRQRGHYRHIYHDDEKKKTINKGQFYVTHKEFVSHIEKLLKQTRGRELPGTFNPMIISDLFMEQSAPWEDITRLHLSRVWNAVTQFVRLVVSHVADKATATALMREIFEPQLDELRKGIDAKTSELLVHCTKGHPITYNHYFTENLQKIRHERREKEVLQSLQKFFNVSDVDSPHEQSGPIQLRELFNSIVQSREPDMGRFASSEALDCLLAYYKVALKRFIDNIAVEVIEERLLASISALFSPITVFKMAPEVITQIAGESEDYRSLREQLTKKLAVLMRGSETCKRFIGIREITIENMTENASKLHDGDPAPQEQVSGHMDTNETSTDCSNVSVIDERGSMDDIDLPHGTNNMEDNGDLGHSEANEVLVVQERDKVEEFSWYPKKSKSTKKNRKTAKGQQSLVGIEIPGEEFAEPEPDT